MVFIDRRSEGPWTCWPKGSHQAPRATVPGFSRRRRNPGMAGALMWAVMSQALASAPAVFPMNEKVAEPWHGSTGRRSRPTAGASVGRARARAQPGRAEAAATADAGADRRRGAGGRLRHGDRAPPRHHRDPVRLRRSLRRRTRPARLRAKSVPPSGDWLSERLRPRRQRAGRGHAGRRDGRPQADVTSRPRRPRTGLRAAQAWPGGGLRAGSGRQSSITEHAKTHPILHTVNNSLYSRLRGLFCSGPAAPGPRGRGGRSTVDVNKVTRGGRAHRGPSSHEAPGEDAMTNDIPTATS